MLLITHVHLLTMTGPGVGYINDGAVAIQGDRITAVGPSANMLARHQGADVFDGSGHVLMPGLIDAHMHTPWALVRGVAQDVANWMQKGLAPYARHMTRESMLAGTRLAIVEAVQNGTTTFGDYVSPTDEWGEVFSQSGVRARLTPTINAMPEKDMSSWRVGDVYPLDDAIGSKSIHRAMDFVDQWHNAGQGRITTMFGPQGPDMISREQLLEVKRLAESRGLMIHMHTAQGEREINQMEQRYGMRTPAYLQEIGYLDDQLLAVHLTEATDSETELIARSGAGMVLCSGSIGIIDGIVPPAQTFRRAGGNVALGSDQAAGNNCHNMFTEMKLTALFNKIRSRDPTVVPAWEALRMATIEGAHAIGLGKETGSIETGKQADLVLVNMKQANLLPVLNGPVRTIVPNLVYAATGREVSHSMVAGKWVMQNRQLVNMDLNAILEDAQYQAEQVAQRITEDPAHEQLALLQPTRDGML